MLANTNSFPDYGITQFIDAILAKVRQGKGVDEWMDKVRSMPDSFYAATKAAKGIDAAELELEEVVRESKYRKVTGAAVKIITGVGELAKADIEAPLVEFHSVPPSRSLGQMLMNGCRGTSPMFLVVSNSTPEFFRYADLRNSEVWSPSGTLGLQAIIISARVEEKHTEDVSVSLMLVPPVRFGRHNEKREGYILAMLNDHGGMMFTTLTCKIRQHHSVHHALGRVSEDRIVEELCMSGGDPEDHLGFPGSYEYLLSNLDGLGEYLTDLSVLMAKKK